MKKYFKYLIIAILLVQFSSCEGILDKYPLDGPSDGTFLSSEAELTAAVAACYQGLWWEWDGVLPFSIGFDQITDLGWDRNVNSAQMQQLGQNAHDGTNKTLSDIWSRMYTYIARCNYVLKNMERGEGTVPSGVYDQSMAEARFLRALYYHYLIELWGDVPLITEPLTLSTGQKARTHKADIVRFLFTELDDAAPHLPKDIKPTAGRATEGAAYALKSRIALYAGEWDVAIAAAEKVMAMEGSRYILDDDYMSLFQYEGMDSKEILFSIQYLKGTKTHPTFRAFGPRNATGHTNKKPAYQTADMFECTDGLSIDQSPLFDPKDPFVNRDPRLGYTLAVPGSIYCGYQFETHGDSIRCWNYNVTPAVRIENQEAIHAYASFTGICWRKYVDTEDRADMSGDLNAIVIRYAEVLLNYAEAKIEKNDIADGKALEAINKIRQRKSVDMPPVAASTQTDLRNAVRRERKYELAGEGLRLFDIRRWKTAEIVMNEPLLGRMKKDYPDSAPRIDEQANVFYEGTGIPIADQGESADHKMRVVEYRSFNKDKDYLWPIPTVEVNTNPNINDYE